MADVRPLPGLRFAAEDELAALVTPPFNVISPEAQARYYARHPHNLIRLELGREESGDDDLNNRYTRAAVTFAEWRLQGVLRQDPLAFYLYEQRFRLAGNTLTRQGLLARVRVEPWETGVILPHERTLAKPKDDRLRLMRACAAAFSPLMSVYDDPARELEAALAPLRERLPNLMLTDEDGEEHRVWAVHDPRMANTVATFFAPRQLYVVDGHHRYETALAYRDEVRELHKELTPEESVNFAMMVLTAIDDPGLRVLPTHRILRELDDARLAVLDARLAKYFTVAPMTGEDTAVLVEQLAAAGAEDGHTAFVMLRPKSAALLRLRPAGAAAMSRLARPSDGVSPAWRGLDVAILHTLVLREVLGIADEAVTAGQHVTYTRDAAEARAAVSTGAGGAQLAILLNATPTTAMRDVARAGERMPQKSTYFYPKLLSGLVINPLW